MVYLTLPKLLVVAERAVPGVVIRDSGLLGSAPSRPQPIAFDEDAYLSLSAKVAALLHSIARNRALVDGNKRLALAATPPPSWVERAAAHVLQRQGVRVGMAVAAGTVHDVDQLEHVRCPRRLGDSR